MTFTPKHVVTMVACVCAAVVLAPVGVLAATGTLVNITDPTDANRKARVTQSGSVQVESRAGVVQNMFNLGFRATNLGHFYLTDAIGPQRVALTEITLGSHGPTNGSTSGHNFVDLVSYVQTTGAASACGTTTTGYIRTEHRRFVVMNLTPTFQVTFDGPPFLSPTPPAGKKVCLTLEVSTFTTGSQVNMGVTGYRNA